MSARALATIALVLAAQTDSAQTTAGIQRAAWLQGCWLAYEARPSGQEPATFLSTRISESELVFENPAHDFPQEVGYRRAGEGLLAWIRGTRDGKDRRIEFPYTRARCGS